GLEVIQQPIASETGGILNGAYGGNIEPIPGQILVIGDNMPQELQDFLHQNSPGFTIHSFPVGWMDTGHVDEVIMALPNKNHQANECHFALGIASPQLARDLIKKHRFNTAHSRIAAPLNSTLSDSEIYGVT